MVSWVLISAIAHKPSCSTWFLVVQVSVLRFYRSYSAGILYPDAFHLAPEKTNRPEFWNNRARFFPSPIATQLSYLFKVKLFAIILDPKLGFPQAAQPSILSIQKINSAALLQWTYLRTHYWKMDLKKERVEIIYIAPGGIWTHDLMTTKHSLYHCAGWNPYVT